MNELPNKLKINKDGEMFIDGTKITYPGTYTITSDKANPSTNAVSMTITLVVDLEVEGIDREAHPDPFSVPLFS